MGGCQKLSTFPITIITGWVGVGKNGIYQLLFITFFQMFFLYCSGKKVFSEKKQSNFCLQTSIEQLQNFFLLLICFKLSLTKQLKLNKDRLSCWLKYFVLAFHLLRFHDLDVSLDGGPTIKFEFSLS